MEDRGLTGGEAPVDGRRTGGRGPGVTGDWRPGRRATGGPGDGRLEARETGGRPGGNGGKRPGIVGLLTGKLTLNEWDRNELN